MTSAGAAPPDLPGPDAGAAREARAYWPLWVRIVFLSVLLVLLLQAAGFAVIRHTLEANARRVLASDMQVGARVWGQLLEQRADRLRQAAAVLARDYAFRDALSTNDRETIESALANHGGRIDAALAVAFDNQFQERGAVLPEGLAEASMLRARLPELARGGWGIQVVQGRPFQIVAAPIRTPLTIGWVAMGFPLDAATLQQLHDITSLQATLWVRATGQLPRLLGSTLGTEQAATMMAGADAGEAVLDGDRLLTRLVAVGEGDGERVQLQLAGSLEQALTPFLALQVWLLAITAGAVLLFALCSLAIARHVTRPLTALMAAADQLGRGRYDVPLAAARRRDEFGALTAAFERMRQGIRAEMYFDQRLTGLPNRQHFRHELERAVATGEPVAVLLVGLNRFKEVNRRIGYSAGDRLLQAMSTRLQHSVRPEDFTARLAGDVFAVLLPRTGEEAARRAAARIGQQLEQPLELDGHRVDRQASIGLACAPLHAQAAEQLLKHAEIALYAAKDRREAVVVYDPSIDRESEANLALLSDLRHARENGELRLHLQPKVHLGDGRLAGAEALLRWQHPQLGMVPPGRFIPYAEDTPIIKDLTLWVFEAVVRQQAELAAHGIDRVSINLSARDLMDLQLVDKLDVVLRRHDARAEALCLETTESAVMNDIDRARQTLQQLRERGFKLSIDDFGEGQTSMRYLQQLPVHELKIDMVFVKGMQTDPRTEAIVRALIDVGHEYGLSVVAEGVENAAVARRLAELGCDEGQGWHFARPMPVDELTAWAHTARARLAAAALDDAPPATTAAGASNVAPTGAA